MRTSILETIQCPGCGATGDFGCQADQSNDTEIREGRIRCNGCGASFGIHAGVMALLIDGEIREEVTREAEGWTQVYGGWFDLTGEKSNFWLIEPDNAETEGITSDEFIRRLPHFDRIGPSFQEREGYKIQSYHELLEFADIREGDRLLELGAAKCWTVRDFARRGCRCVATEIVTTKYVGLETSDIYFEEDPQLYWERVRCDMEDLPFAPESFDIVFCNAVLHHSKDPAKILRGIWNALAPGGRLLIVNEPDYGLYDKRRHRQSQIEETATGANENLYNQRFFVRELRRIGFQTDFRPYLWLVKFYAWRIYEYSKRYGVKEHKRQQEIEDWLLRHDKLARYLIGLGTMGVATKPATAKKAVNG